MPKSVQAFFEVECPELFCHLQHVVMKLLKPVFDGITVCRVDALGLHKKSLVGLKHLLALHFLFSEECRH